MEQQKTIRISIGKKYQDTYDYLKTKENMSAYILKLVEKDRNQSLEILLLQEMNTIKDKLTTIEALFSEKERG